MNREQYLIGSIRKFLDIFQAALLESDLDKLVSMPVSTLMDLNDAEAVYLFSRGKKPHPTALRFAKSASGELPFRPAEIEELLPPHSSTVAVDFKGRSVAIASLSDETEGLTVVMVKKEGETWNEEDLPWLAIAARHIAMAFHVRETMEAKHVKQEQVRALLEVGKSIRLQEGLESVLKHIGEGIRRSLGWGVVLISLRDEVTGLLSPIVVVGLPDEESRKVMEWMRPKSLDRELLRRLSIRVHRSYFMDHRLRTPEDTRGLISERRLMILSPEVPEEIQPGKWHPEDALVVPIELGDKLLGLISVDEPEDGKIPDEESVRALEVFADYAAAAIENARLLSRAQETTRGLEILHKVSLKVSSSLNVQEVQDAILEGVMELVPATDSHIFLYDPEKDVFFSGRGLWRDGSRDIIREPRRGGLTHTVATRGRPVVISDAMSHPLFKNDQASVKTGLRAIAGIPLMFQGKVVGVMNVAFTESSHYFTDEELHLLTLLGAQAAVAITNAQRYKELLEHSREIARLKDFNEYIVNAMEEGLMLVDPDGKVSFVNPRMESMAGHARLLGTCWRDLVQLSENQSGEVIDCLDRQTPAQCSAYLKSKSGKPLPVQISMTPLKDGRYLFVFADISRQKRTEEMLHALNSASISLHQAHDVDSVLHAAGEELKKLGFDILVTLLEPGGKDATCRYSSLSPERQGAIEDASKGSLVGFTFPIEKYPLYRKVLFSREAIVQQGMEEVVGALLQDILPTHRVRRVQDAMAMGQVIHAPIIGSSGPIGVLTVGAEDVSQEDIAPIMAFAHQLGVALDNARLVESERRQRQISETLQKVAEILGSTLDLEGVLPMVLEQIRKVVPYDSGGIFLREGDVYRFVVSKGQPQEEKVRGLTVKRGQLATLDRLEETGEVVIIPDTDDSPLWTSIPGTRHIRSWLGVPLMVEGKMIGAMGLDKLEPRFYTEEHARLAATFAHHAAMAIQRARLYSDLQRRLEELQVLARTSQALNSAQGMDEVLDVTLEATLELTQHSQAAILFFDREANWVKMVRARGLSEEVVRAFNRRHITLQEGTFAIVLRTGKVVRIEGGAAKDPRVVSDYLPEGVEFPDQITNIPLQVKGRTIGVISVDAALDDETLNVLLSTVAEQASIAIEREKLLRDLQQRLREMEALINSSQKLHEAKTLSEVLNAVLDASLSVTGGKKASVILRDRQTHQMRIAAYRGISPETVHRFNVRPVYDNDGTFAWVVKHKRLLLIPDTSHPPKGVGFVDEVDAPSEQLANVPLVYRGDVIGVIALDKIPANRRGKDLLLALAGIAAAAIEKAMLYSREQRRVQQLEAVSEITNAISGIPDPEEIPKVLVDLLRRRLSIKYAHVFLLDGADRDGLSLASSTLLGDDQVELPDGRTVLDRAIESRAAVRVDDLQMDEEILPLHDLASIRSQLAAPMLSRGQVEGVLVVESDLPGAFDEADEALVEALADHMNVALENARLIERLRRQTRELQAAYNELKELDRMKEEFVAIVSHELRTPLTFLRGYLELLNSGSLGPLNEKQKHAVEVMDKRTRVLVEMVNDIIDLQKAKLSKMVTSPVSLPDIVTSLVEEATPSAREQGIRFELDIPQNLPDVLGDRSRLIRVFDNLIGNAVKFSPDGGTITISMKDIGEFVEVRIKDQGVGIPPDRLEDIFRLFYQVDSSTSRRFPGSGLGLSVVKQIIEAHGGTIWAESDGEHGSTFVFRLPKAPDSEA